MFKINPWVILGVVLALIGAFGYGASIGAKFEASSQLKDEARLAAVADAAQGSAAAAIARLKPVNKTIRMETEREVQNNTVYSDCRITADGLRLLNQAIDGRTDPAGRSVLPEAGPVGQ